LRALGWLCNAEACSLQRRPDLRQAQSPAMRHLIRGSSRASRLIIRALAAVGLLVAQLSFFKVESGEYAVVTEFGDPVQVVTTPGLGIKYPYQSVRKFDARLYVYAPPLSEFLTRDKTAVVASGVVLWRIEDPRKFFETVFSRTGAESRLSDILFAELGAAIGGSSLDAFVATDRGAYRAEEIVAEVAEQCRRTARRDYGIEVVDVQLQRFDFPERNRLRVYARMKSERARLSMKYRSEGEEEGLKIRAEADGERVRIGSEAYKVAEQRRGEGEAEAARIYAQTLEAAPDFYRFLRTLETSRKFIGEGTTLVLPADSELFGLLYDSRHYQRPGRAASDGAAPAQDGAQDEGDRPENELFQR
jgi:modulator of FtsH protease HflC